MFTPELKVLCDLIDSIEDDEVRESLECALFNFIQHLYRDGRPLSNNKQKG